MIIAFALAAIATPPTPVEQIIATERAFAADTAQRGGAYSFRVFVAPAAVGLFPDPKTGVLQLIDAKQRIVSRPLPPAPKPVAIRWWPAFAGASAAGDLGFTAGPVIFPRKDSYGFVFTVWERQPGGGWKFHFDGGPKIDGPSPMTAEQPVRLMATARVRAESPQAAAGEVAAAEARIAARTAKGLTGAYAPFLTDHTLLMGSGGQPIIGRRDAAAELGRRGRTIAFERLGVRAAKSGDFVFTYGRALINGSVHGGYARIWQRTRAGWRLVVDQVQAPDAPPG